MFYIILIILAIILWKWLKPETRQITAGTVNRLGLTSLMAANKCLDQVDDSLGLDQNYYNELVDRYSNASTKKR